MEEEENYGASNSLLGFALQDVTDFCFLFRKEKEKRIGN